MSAEIQLPSNPSTRLRKQNLSNSCCQPYYQTGSGGTRSFWYKVRQGLKSMCVVTLCPARVDRKIEILPEYIDPLKTWQNLISYLFLLNVLIRYSSMSYFPIHQPLQFTSKPTNLLRKPHLHRLRQQILRLQQFPQFPEVFAGSVDAEAFVVFVSTIKTHLSISKQMGMIEMKGEIEFCETYVSNITKTGSTPSFTLVWRWRW